MVLKFYPDTYHFIQFSNRNKIERIVSNHLSGCNLLHLIEIINNFYHIYYIYLLDNPLIHGLTIFPGTILLLKVYHDFHSGIKLIEL